jgi:biopolymer transport protein ExbB
MIDIVQKGGPLIWLVLLCSITALGVFMERLFYFHRASINTGEFLRGLANTLRRGDFGGALHECASTPGPVARVAHAVVVRHDISRADLRDVASEAGQLEVPKLERNLPLLATVAYVTPLIGLLGTILGLLQTFETIGAQGGNASATDIAGGVYWGLLASASALAVAIPAFVAHSFLSARVNDFLRDMERTGIELLAVIDELHRTPRQKS